MNGHTSSHGRQVATAGAVVAAGMIAIGVGRERAVTWGILLARPLGMRTKAGAITIKVPADA